MSRRPRLLLLLAIFLLAGFPALISHPVAAAGTADLAVTMVGNKKVLKFGDIITFTVTVTNLGPDPATGVTLGVGASDSFEFFGGTCPDGNVSTICPIGALAFGESVTLHFQARARNECCPKRLGVAAASVYSDTATIDPVVANNEIRVETKLVGKTLSWATPPHGPRAADVGFPAPLETQPKPSCTKCNMDRFGRGSIWDWKGLLNGETVQMTGWGRHLHGFVSCWMG